MSSWDKTGGQQSSGPAGSQRYSASGAGSTLGSGGMQSHTFNGDIVQHGS
jgi:hypothetical protein